MASPEDELKQALSSLSDLSDLHTPSDEPTASSSRTDTLRLLSASTPLFSSLKRVNRHVYTDLQSQKTRVAEERAKVDTARLALQNLKYEESMLELEVKVCAEFQSIFQDIPMHSLEEFKALQNDEESLGDEHKLMLARLRFELEERKRLEQEKQGLQQEKGEVVRENKEKKVKLEQAERELKDLLAVSCASSSQNEVVGTDEITDIVSAIFVINRLLKRYKQSSRASKHTLTFCFITISPPSTGAIGCNRSNTRCCIRMRTHTLYLYLRTSNHNTTSQKPSRAPIATPHRA